MEEKKEKPKRVLVSWDLTPDQAVEAIKKQLGIKSFDELWEEKEEKETLKEEEK